LLGILIKRERMAQNMSQEALAAGICSPSYLSKIENGTVECSSELYRLLFHALSIRYISDEALLNRFDEAYTHMLASLRRAEKLKDEESAALLSLCEKLLFSPRGMDAALLAALIRRCNISKEELESLAFFLPFLDKHQRMLYALIRRETFLASGERSRAVQALEDVKSTEEPQIYLLLCDDFFQLGDYRHSMENGLEAYRLFSVQGCVSGMLDAAMLLFACYSNARNRDATHRWLAVARNLNETAKDPYTSFCLSYNEGATRLVIGDFAGALLCLEEAAVLSDSPHIDTRHRALLNQKLALAYILSGNAKKAFSCLDKIENCDETEALALSVRLMHYMLATPDYVLTKTYRELLEACFYAAENEQPRGVLEFYGGFLLDAYRKNRQYKKMALLMEKYKLSFLFE
jgi:transcriptional regulator with XRE-family HTH domain